MLNKIFKHVIFIIVKNATKVLSSIVIYWMFKLCFMALEYIVQVLFHGLKH